MLEVPKMKWSPKTRSVAQAGLSVVRAGRHRVAGFKEVLVEVRHLDARVGAIESDGVGERAARDRYARARGEVRLHVVAEVVTEDEELARASREVVAERVEVHERRARVGQRLEGSLHGGGYRCGRRDERIESIEPL